MNEVMIGFRNLTAFVTMVEENSFTKAAEKLYQTQPALSIQIKKLENALGAQLIERKEKEILLTDAGEIFYPEAKRILEHYTRTLEAIDELKEMQRGRLLICASTLPGEYILPKMVGAFQRQYPGVQVELNIADTDKVTAALKNRQAQIGFLGVSPLDPKLTVETFEEDELYLLVSPDDTKKISWPAFPLDRLILREKGSGTRRVVEENLKRKLNLQIITPKMEVGSTQAVINMIAAGLGIGFVSRWAAEDAITLGKVKVYPGDEFVIKRKLYKAVLKDSYLSNTTKAFWELATSKP